VSRATPTAARGERERDKDTHDGAARVVRVAPEGAEHAAPLMIRKKRGLVAEVTEFDLLFCGGNVLAQLVRFSLKGLAVMLAEEPRPHRVAAVAITPGYLRSEFMLEHSKITEENWRDGAKKDKNFLESESPLFVGRAVVALAADRKVFERTGALLSSYGLAREYGFTDYDGRRPDFGRKFAEMGWMKESLRRHVEWLDGLTRRTKQYLGEGQATPAPRATRNARTRGKARADASRDGEG
jgi:NAD(P)-dependent dehydrogenase (short-subunit alcohol dehydrogenase family)